VIGAAMQAQLKDIGMTLDVQPVPFANIVAAIRDGTMQMTLLARGYVSIPDVIAAIMTDFTRERSTQGAVNWEGRKRMNELCNAYVQSFDEAGKATLRKDILELIRDEVPVTPISWFEHTVAVHKRVKGFVADPFEARYMLHKVSLT
jgi:peptide/nickel transport system substrate-binding protein